MKETPLITASFFGGFVALYLLELLAYEDIIDPTLC